jgi:hypothetical protein
MFLTGTANIQPGNEESFVLDYDALASLAGTIDPYFAEKEVYREVFCLYQEASSVASRPQRKTLNYKNGTTISSMVFSIKANPGIWSISKILINDKDGGELIIRASQIPDLALYDLMITAV